jgi:hypothetical protein
VIGSLIPPLARYHRMLDEHDASAQEQRAISYLKPEESELELRRLAYALWERAGRPVGHDHEFWEQAQRDLGAHLLAEDDLRAVHRRPLDLAEALP